MSELSVTELAELVGGKVVGDADRKIHGVAPLAEAGPGQLSFVAKSKYLPYLEASRAGVVLIGQSFAQAVDGTGPTQIIVEDPHAALTRVLLALQPEEHGAGGVHPTAVVAPDVELAEGVSIGAYAVVGAGSKIGSRTRIGAHCVIGEECVIGEDCRIDASVTLYERVVLENRCIIRSGARVGGHGFGYVWMDGGHTKVPQIGGCRICDDVELGMNVTVDRGSVGETVVGRGTKVDNLVHIGHNVKIGEHVLLVAQVGISGSTSVGDGAVLAGQVGVAGHLTIGAGARIGGQAGVLRDVPAGATYSGMPARLHREVLRAQAALLRLPDLVRRVRGVERALGIEEGSTSENE